MSRKKIVDMKKVKKEEREELEKDLVTSTEVSEKVLPEKVKKLKCDYRTFRIERNKAKMRVPEKCELCNKKLKDDNNVYVAWGKDLKEIFICEECAEKVL